MSHDDHLERLVFPEEFRAYPVLMQAPSTQRLNAALGRWSEMPSRYEWVYEADEAIKSRLFSRQPLPTQGILDDEIREAFARDALAYEVMQGIRVHELVRAGLLLASRGLAVGAAGSARSAVEASLAVWMTTRKFKRAFGETPDRGTRKGEAEHDRAIADLQKYLERATYGGRAESRPVSSPGVTTAIEAFVKVSDAPTGEALTFFYDELSDIVHPSASGHQFYWHFPLSISQRRADKPWRVSIDASRPNETLEKALTAVVWGIVFASETSLGAFDELCQTVPEPAFAKPSWWTRRW